MTSRYRLRRTPDSLPDGPSFIEGRRKMNDSIEAETESYEFPARDCGMDSFMETYESGRDALFYE